VSSQIEPFECHWQHSRQLLYVYCAALVTAFSSLLVASIPLWSVVIGAVLCVAHACWAIPGPILLQKANQPRRLKHDKTGWHLWSPERGWHSVRLSKDSLALPLIVIVRYTRAGERLKHSVCIPSDAMAPEMHRRLRMRLRLAPQRWTAPE
jgi:toxin CptA